MCRVPRCLTILNGGKAPTYARGRTHRLKPQDGEEIFGHGNTWAELYAYVHMYAAKQFGHRCDSLAHDAASEGYLRATRKNWKKLEADTPALRARNWNYVKRVARLETGSFLIKEDSRPEDTISCLIPGGLPPEASNDFVDALFGEHRQSAPPPDEEVVERDLQERAWAALHELAQDPQEWNTWLRDLVAGLTTREVAERESVSHVAIQHRRNRGIARIQPVLKRHGLAKEDTP